MPITKRTLEKWRGEALKVVFELESYECVAELTSQRREQAKRIVKLTGVLLDQELMKKTEK